MRHESNSCEPGSSVGWAIRNQGVIAVKRPIVVDYLLVFAASCVITVAIWPRQEARQIFRLQSSDGQWKTRSLALNDPVLQSIENQIDAAAEFQDSPQFAVQNWQSELADFYRKNPVEKESFESISTDDQTAVGDSNAADRATTASISDEIVTASYEKNSASATSLGTDPVQQTSLRATDPSPSSAVDAGLIEENSKHLQLIVPAAPPVELKEIIPPQNPKTPKPQNPKTPLI